MVKQIGKNDDTASFSFPLEQEPMFPVLYEFWLCVHGIYLFERAQEIYDSNYTSL